MPLEMRSDCTELNAFICVRAAPVAIKVRRAEWAGKKQQTAPKPALDLVPCPCVAGK